MRARKVCNENNLQVDFFKAGFALWTPKTGTGRSMLLGPQAQIYNLIRTGASKHAKAHPWELIVQKKIVWVRGVKGAVVSKSISCSRPLVEPNADEEKFCCVQKATSGADISTLGTEKQTRVLYAIMKI